MLETTGCTFPTRPLSRLVEDVRVLVPAVGRVDPFEWLPDGRTALVVRVREGGRTGDAALLGPHTRTLVKTPTGIARVVLLQFKPGWTTSLFGVNASALVDQIVTLEALWGRVGAETEAELLESRTASDVLDCIARAAHRRHRARPDSSSAVLARRAAHLLEAHIGPVEPVAAELGVTSRHLRRVFTESIGISPKAFVRGVRLRRAVQMAATAETWGRIAADAGYYDQAHLIADFRELLGVTPGAYRRRMRAPEVSKPPRARKSPLSVEGCLG